jgi:preprotein translocase subunit SecE
MKSPSGMSETSTPAPAAKKRVGPFTFLGQVRAEARKVTWTTRQETIWATAMVIVMVVIASIFFYVTDAVVSLIVRLIVNVGGLSNG